MISLKKLLKLGATGAFPDGKVNATDEGELRFAVMRDGDLVRVEFGKPVAWFAISPNQAKEIAALLMRCAGGSVSN